MTQGVFAAATRREPLRALALIVGLAAWNGCSASITGEGDDTGDPGGRGGSGAVAGGASFGGAAVGSGGSGGSVQMGTSGATSSGGKSSEPPPPGQPRPVSMEGEPIYSRLLRLTNDQWENSVRDILKLSAPSGLSKDFIHAVSGVTDFDNNERVVIVNNTVWSDFQSAAEKVAAQVTATDQALQAVVATTDAATFIKTFGRRAFRRDLTTDEVTDYQTLFSSASTYSGSQSAFTKGAGLVIAGMLQSPHFLYRQEMGDNGKPLSGYEMAAKLSLWLRDTTPTDAMLDAAKAGTFGTADGAAMQAQQMLEDPAAKTVLRKFHGSLYKIEVLDTITKTAVNGYSEKLLPEFKEASYLFFDRLFTQNLGIKDMLTSTVAFAGPTMAQLYGVSTTGTGVQQVTLTGRPGWYSQMPFLTMWAINNDPDSIHRGVRINLDTLCADPGLPTFQLPSVPAIEPNQTNRLRYEGLTNACGGTCHKEIINPIGFAFENFDGLGRFRETDNGQPVNTTGSYPFAEGTQPFSNATEMMQIIANGKQAHQCYSKKMASYALQRDLIESDRPLVDALGESSRTNNASLRNVMLSLVKNDAFRNHVGGAQ